MKEGISACSTTIPEAWQMLHRLLEKGDQMVTKIGIFKKEGLVMCLKISSLQGLFCAPGGNNSIGDC